MQDDKNNKVKSGLPLSAIAILMILIVILCVAFWKQDFQLNSETIILIIVIVAVSLSGVYNSFSIGQLLSMTKQKNQVQEQNVHLEQERKKLLVKLAELNVSVRNSLSLTNTINNGSAPTPTELSADEEKEYTAEEDELLPKSEDSLGSIPLQKLKNLVICKHFSNKQSSSIKRIKLENNDMVPDPISNRAVFFDDRIASDGLKSFVYVIRNTTDTNISGLFERIYIRLTKVLRFKQAQEYDNEKINMIILVATDNQETNKEEFSEPITKKLRETFKPAIKAGLLILAEEYIDVANDTQEE